MAKDSELGRVCIARDKFIITSILKDGLATMSCLKIYLAKLSSSKSRKS